MILQAAGDTPGGSKARDHGVATSPSTTGEAGRVLVVEDEYFVGMATEGALLDGGYEVVGIAATADEAVALAEATRPDLVLVDIRLGPGRDGIAAANDIRERLGIASVFATAQADPGTAARGAAAKPAGWVLKPFSPEELLAAVAAAIRAGRLS